MTDSQEETAWVNEVHLVGRVSGQAEERTLPSGDVLVQLRVVVPRPEGSSGSRVDTLDVACWGGRVRQAASRLGSGDEVEVTGALRRRFFRAGAATVSRYEVEATKVSRLRRPGNH